MASRVIIEGLDAHPIPCKEQRVGPPVPDGEREHAVEPLHASLAEILVEMDDDFRVAPCSEPMPLGHQVLTDLLKIVDLAVEDDPDRFIFVAHRLVPGRAIDDAEPPVPEPDMLIKENVLDRPDPGGTSPGSLP